LSDQGYAVLASEVGNIPIDSSKHSYDVCLDAARTCDCLIAIIDSRFGGVMPDGRTSITQAEVQAALDHGKQVFVFVRQAVWDGKEVYSAYKKAGQPFRPTKIVHDERIFELIDAIRRRAKANWIFQFNLPDDLIATALFQLQAMYSRPARVPFQACLSPPPHFLERSNELSAIKVSLLATEGSNVAITGQGAVGVQGMGGVGKTVLAAALTRDPEVQRAFPDGIFWLTLGQQPNLLGVMNQLAGWLPDCDGALTTEPAAQSAIRQALAGKRALLILDDAWHLDHAAALNLVSAPGRLLVTTRKREVLVGLAAHEFRVDVLSLPEAVRMLADWAGVKDPALLPPQATDVAQECGRLPLALAMIGAMVQLRPTVWLDALEFLRSRDLEEFRRAFPDYPYPDLLRAIAVSVDELPPDDRERYLDLAVFPEDAPIPEGPLQVLWGLTPPKTRACMDRLTARSLGAMQQIGAKTVLLLHDLQGDYIRKQREKQLPALHTRLLNAYAARCKIRNSKFEIRNGTKWAQGPDDGYFFQRFAWHLKQTGREKELRSLLLDFEWLQAKLNATDAVALVADFDDVNGDEELSLVQSAIRLSSHAIGPDKNQLASQLVGRLSGETTPQIRQLVASACGWRGAPWLRPLNGNLHPPGTALLRTLLSHGGPVWAVAVSADGRRVISGDMEGSLRMWDVGSGREMRTLKNQGDWITTVAISSDGHRAISGDSEGTLKVWNVESGRELWTRKGHAAHVINVSISADGRRAVSASGRTPKVWDVESGRMVRTLRGHAGRVCDVAMSADGRWVLSASGRMLKVWDVESGLVMRTLRSHTGKVYAVAMSADARWALTGSDGGTITMWDIAKGIELRTLEGHVAAVSAVALRADLRRAVSGSSDQTLKVWDLERWRELWTLEGHSSEVLALALSADGRLAVSGSEDSTLKVWNVESRQRFSVPEGHDSSVFSIAMSADGQRAVSAAWDNTLKVWDVKRGRELRMLVGHARWVNDVALSADGQRAVSGSLDQTLKVWDVENGQELRTLKGHAARVDAVAISVDGRRAVSGSEDKTLKVWDVESGLELRTLRGHTDKVNAVALSADGRLAVSGGWDATLKVWDVEVGREVQTLQGHTRCVEAVALSPCGRWAVSGSGDQSLKVWDLESGRELRTLKGHAGWVRAVALSVDGRLAMSGSDDGTLKLWDVENGQCLAIFTGESGIGCCALASDAFTISAGESSGRIHFLRLVMPNDPLEEEKPRRNEPSRRQ
jgi:WD40 repeat protein